MEVLEFVPSRKCSRLHFTASFIRAEHHLRTMPGIGEVLFEKAERAANYNHELAVANTMRRAEELALESPAFLEELKKLIKAFRKL